MVNEVCVRMHQVIGRDFLLIDGVVCFINDVRVVNDWSCLSFVFRD